MRRVAGPKRPRRHRWSADAPVDCHENSDLQKVLTHMRCLETMAQQWKSLSRRMTILTDIRLVDIFDPVSYESIGNDEKIQFQDEFPLFRAVILSKPMIPGTTLTFGVHS